MTPGLLIDTDGHTVLKIVDGQPVGEMDPVVAGWFKNGVPGFKGYENANVVGDVIEEVATVVAPTSPVFLLAVLEEAERRDWTIIEERPDPEQKSEVGDKPDVPFGVRFDKSDWQEDKHPRAKTGEFAPKGATQEDEFSDLDRYRFKLGFYVRGLSKPGDPRMNSVNTAMPERPVATPEETARWAAEELEGDADWLHSGPGYGVKMYEPPTGEPRGHTADNIAVYHGTTESAIESILRDGIVPASPRYDPGGESAGPLVHAARQKSVYVTTSLQEALHYASERGVSDKFIVFEAEVPDNQLITDEVAQITSESDDPPTGNPDMPTEAYRVERVIEPGSIRGYKVYDAKTLKVLSEKVIKSAAKIVYIPVVVMPPEEEDKSGTFDEHKHPRSETGEFTSGGGQEASAPEHIPYEHAMEILQDQTPFPNSSAEWRADKLYNYLADKHMPELESGEEQSLNDYIDTGYRDLNGLLRGKPSSHVDRDAMTAMTEGLDSIFSKLKPIAPMTLYRGFSGTFLRRLKPGDEFVDDGFVSTSFRLTTAATFGGNPESSPLACIKTSAKTKTLLSAKSTEFEAILPRGSRFKVTDISYVNPNDFYEPKSDHPFSEDKRKMLTLEVVDD